TATAGRNAAEVRLEGRRTRRRARVDAVKDDRPTRRRSGSHRTSEQPEEIEVDRAIAELRIEAAGEVAARAGQLELDAGPRRAALAGDDDPRPVHLHADLQAAAFVRRARGRGGGSHCGECGDENERTLHGTLRNHSADRPPPINSSAAEPPAKRS